MAQEMGERLMMVQVPSNKSTIPAATAKANVPHLSNKSCKHWKAAATAKEKDQAFAPRFTFHWCYVEDVCHAKNGWYGKVAISTVYQKGKAVRMKYCAQH